MTTTDSKFVRHRAPLTYAAGALTCTGLAVLAVVSGDSRWLAASLILAIIVPTSIAFAILVRAHARARQDAQTILNTLIDMRYKQSRKEFQIRTEIADVHSQVSALRDRIRALEGATHEDSSVRTKAEARIAHELSAVRARLDSFGEESASESEHAALNELLLSLMLNQDTIIRSLEAGSGTEQRRTAP